MLSDSEKIVQLLRLINEKDELLRKLSDRITSQEQQITDLTKTTHTPNRTLSYRIYKQFLQFEGDHAYLTLRLPAQTLSSKSAIQLSPNVEITGQAKKIVFRTIAVQTDRESVTHSQLGGEVEELKQNLGKCETFIAELQHLQARKEEEEWSARLKTVTDHFQQLLTTAAAERNELLSQNAGLQQLLAASNQNKLQPLDPNAKTESEPSRKRMRKYLINF